MASPPWKVAKTGRPSLLNTIIGTRPDGDPITTADRIVQSLRTGGYLEPAAASAGVHKDTAYGWLRVGAQTLRSIHAGKTTWHDHTQHERDCAEFSVAVERAEAEALAEDIALTQKLARGGYDRTIETVKRDNQGQIVDRTTRTERAEPDGAMLRWRLERRHPKLFGRTLVEVSGIDGAPIEVSLEDRRADLIAGLDLLATRLAEEADWDAFVAGELGPVPEEAPEA